MTLKNVIMKILKILKFKRILKNNDDYIYIETNSNLFKNIL